MAATQVAENTVPSHAPGSGAIRLRVGVPKESNQFRRNWWFDAPDEATREDAMHPSFWANVSKYFTRHDLITLIAADQSWELELCVEAVRQSGVDVSVRKNYARTAVNRAGTMVGDDHRTEYRSNEGWCVVRVKDGHAVVRGHSLEPGAINQFHRERPRPAA